MLRLWNLIQVKYEMRYTYNIVGGIEKASLESYLSLHSLVEVVQMRQT